MILALLLGALWCACGGEAAPKVEPGVSVDLARWRSSILSDLSYDVQLRIPADSTRPIEGTEQIRFLLRDGAHDLLLDFVEPSDHIHRVTANDSTIAYEVHDEHIIIPASALDHGNNSITIDFTAGDGSLNRHSDFLYTLFVPDRARFALPVFDQPDLKARFVLTLTVPASWKALSNGPEIERKERGSTATVRFAATRPISTYLFSFVAGKFKTDTAERDGRKFTMYHRETDTAKVARNRDAIFDLHARALAWLEQYTGIPYPFDKFEFALIPSFQYGGMEHPGAILYRAAGLMLDATATQNQLLGRASVIAHETAHMWFGDLVTMKWFNDVWTKEVFANFMAAKIINPSFPDLNHDLRFMMAHHPAAYRVDRTAGANAIRQHLDNLNTAGTLYGAIIYQKAPVVMRQLENIVGPEAFRDGLREYLRQYSYSNATWRDLISILDNLTGEDLDRWSNVWVEEPGRPDIILERKPRVKDAIDMEIEQSDPRNRGRVWPQKLDLLLVYPESTMSRQVNLTTTAAVPVQDVPAPLFVLPNGTGLEYGGFELDRASTGYLLDHLPEIHDELIRGAAWLDLWEAVLDRRAAPIDLMRVALREVADEEVELNLERVLTDTRYLFWSLLTDRERAEIAPELERSLWNRMHTASTPTMKAAVFATYRATALTPPAVRHLGLLWEERETIPGVPLSERDFMALAAELAIRNVADADRLLSQQLARMKNPDRRARFAFVLPALSPDTNARNGFFRSLAAYENRRREPWVLDGIRYLNHPLRRRESLAFITPGLGLLEEIQRTGDIFFPKRWLDALLGQHNSAAASRMVHDFLSEHPGYPSQLRNKILQAADPLFRAARIQSEHQ